MRVENNYIFRYLYILYYIKDGCNLTILSIRTGLSYSLLTEILREFENLGLISISKVGRVKVITLTDKGNDVLQLYNKIYIMLFGNQ